VTAEDKLQPLQALLSLRLADGRPCSEYDLLRWLQQPQQGLFSPTALQETQSMFQAHFLLMHCLYSLRQQWANERSALLDISALQIQKHPWPAHSQQQQPDQHDPLAAYYLDLQHLQTSDDDIEQLLRNFWQRLLQPADEAADLATLELQPPTDAGEIRLQYRKLAMRHHPDRGGQPERFRDIQSAYQRLRQRYL